MLIYLPFMGIISFILMAIDKRRARSHQRRIPEAVLHLFELLGGVYGALLAMYTLRHKNRKISFFLITFLIFLLWTTFIIYLVKTFFFISQSMD